MDGAFSTPLGPILVLWIGALVFYALDRFLEPQDAGVAEMIVLCLGIGSLLVAGSRIGETIDFGRSLADAGWQGVPPFLVAGRTSWTLALILLGVALAASLASLGGPVRGRAGRLAALGATLLTLFAGDWATLALSWVLVDVFLLFILEGFILSSVEGNEGQPARLGRTAFLSLGGAVALGVALLLWQQAEGNVWVDRSIVPGRTPATSIATAETSSLLRYVVGLGLLAALLRLMPFPLPMWEAPPQSPPKSGGRQAHEGASKAGDDRLGGPESPLTRVVLYAVPTVSGIYLWARLAQWEVTAQGGGWLIPLSLWAGLTLLTSALKAWSAQDPKQLIACTPMYGVAFAFLGAGLNLPAPWQWLAGASAVMSVCALLVSWTQCQHLHPANLRSYWRILPTALALLSLAGMPLTAGFPARVAVYHALFAGQRWLLLLLVMAAEAGFLGVSLRIVLDIEHVEIETERVEADTERVEEIEVPPEGLPTIQSEAARSGDRPQQERRNGQRYRQWLREVSYSAGAILALGIGILGVAPALLSAPGPGFWFGLPRVHVWAALLLPIVGAVALYRSQEALSAWMGEWWPLIEQVFHFEWAYRAVEEGTRLIGSAIRAGSRVVEGAGYMAWIVLFCLVVLLLILNR